MHLDRRQFLIAAGGLLAARGSRAADGPAALHVAYPGTSSRAEAEETLEELGRQLGAEVAANLRIAVWRGDWVVIYDRSGVRHPADTAAAERVARGHTALLRRVFEDDDITARVVADTALNDLYDIAYAEADHAPDLWQPMAEVQRMLGPGVAKALVVTRTPGGAHQLVYRRRGGRDRTVEVARHHAALLASVGLKAWAVPGVDTEVVYDGASAAPEPTLEAPRPDAPTAEPRASEAPPPHPEDTAPDEAPEPEEAPPLAEAPTDDAPRGPDDTALDPDDTAAPATADDAVAAPPPDEAPTDDADADDAVAALPPDAPDDAEVVPVVSSRPRRRDASTLGPAASPHPGHGLRGRSTELSARIDEHIQGYRRRGLVSSSERTAWLVYDLHRDTLLASINGERPLQAASMIKPFVGTAFLHEVKRGRFVYGPRSTRHMERMIRYSSNESTNWFIDQVGGPGSTHALLHRNYARVCPHVEVVEYIPSNGRTYRNKASVADHARLLRALWYDRLPHSRELKRVMNLPGSDRLYKGVPSIPVGTLVYNKTGSTARCCGDMGVLVARTPSGERMPYILVGVIERSSRARSYTSWIRSRGDVIRSVSGLVYDHLKTVHGLV